MHDPDRYMYIIIGKVGTSALKDFAISSKTDLSLILDHPQLVSAVKPFM